MPNHTSVSSPRILQSRALNNLKLTMFSFSQSEMKVLSYVSKEFILNLWK